LKVLMINKFLYPNGGSETYIFKLGEVLKRMGHDVEYFGMEHEGRIVGNSVNAYTKDMDFHNATTLEKLSYPIRTIYSSEARKKIRKVLDAFNPDVCHLNNFNYQLTPSIIVEIDKWRNETGHACKIVYTAHDFQLVCPNHMCFNPVTKQNCTKCIGGHFKNCKTDRCIHGSGLKSMLGTMEANYWNRRNIYKKIDSIICCSEFMKKRLDTNPVLASKTVAMHNFIQELPVGPMEKEDYVLYFGRYSYEKGTANMIEACRRLPEINFVFAGKGDYEADLDKLPNVKNVGFKSGEELYSIVSKALFSVCPSILNENCSYSVMESLTLRTPVLGSDKGGIPELIKDGQTGRIFDGESIDDLTLKISEMWNDKERLAEYSHKCIDYPFDSDEEYCEKLLEFYR